MDTLYMEPNTGVVQTLEEWREDYAKMSAEEWGGPAFEDAWLIPVVWDEEAGWWEEAE